MTPRFDIVSIGEPLYELSQQADGRYLQGFGGDSSNLAIAAARLGARTAYVTLVGTDPPGDAFLELWRREGIDASAIGRRAEAPTGVYLITHSGAGHQFTYLRKGSAASLLSPIDVPLALMREARFVHASGVSQAISASAADAVFHAFEEGRKAGARISYDTNLRLRLWPLARARAVINAAAAMADVVKTSLEDGEALTGFSDPQAMADCYLGIGHQGSGLAGSRAKLVVVTLGAQGVYAASADGERIREPGLRMDAVDATGAGDAFMGALLAELARDQPLRASVRFANAAAALSTRGGGAVAPLARREEVDGVLQRT